MSLCVLKTATLAHERIACTKLPPARIIHQYVKRQFQSFPSAWSTPVSSTAGHITAAPVKPAPVFHTPHQFLHNAPMASTSSCQSHAFGICTTPDQTLKKTACNVVIRNMSTELPDDKRLNCEELLNFMKEKKVTLIDVRSREEVQATGLLRGAVNIPVKEYTLAMKAPDQMFKEKFGVDKPKPDDHIVFFCTTGSKSFIAMRAALQMGYKNFSTSSRCYEAEKLPGKITADKSLSYEDIINLMARNEIFLIDVRDPRELRESGELPGCINIPLNEVYRALNDLSPADFQKKYKSKKPGKNAPLVFTCRSGARSYKALQSAVDLGFKKAKHYKGGYMDWVERRKEASRRI